MGRRANNIASFLSKISMGKSCWFWIGTKATTGYGSQAMSVHPIVDNTTERGRKSATIEHYDFKDGDEIPERLEHLKVIYMTETMVHDEPVLSIWYAHPGHLGRVK